MQRSKEIAGVRVDFGLSYKEVLSKIDGYINSDRNHFVWTINPEFVMDAQKDTSFQALLNESSLSLPDGAGLLYANKYLEDASTLKHDLLFPFRAFVYGTKFGFGSLAREIKLGERITGADLMYKICENAADKGQTVLFLGGWEKDSWGRMLPESGNVSQRAADVLKGKYPKLNVVAANSDFKRGEEDDKKTLAFIHNAMKEQELEKIDIIFVAYNHIHQEKWIKRNIKKIPASVGIGIGGSFDYIVGTQHRSPEGFMRRNLEWLYRLFTQPWRMKRILKAFPVFPLFVYYLSVTEDLQP
ncbi:WecB/TagA/CpsF family glycosyltransferase [candidate division WWE3 bacterium]|jgi:N-acetylglucosaminyldiphosphoundecaprenol N-acetyl-beta-D-mannosaminyltransferase|nr:WecB/TagA/CpsF family glycosyltransferase [candidate division WWE3 bacterium]